MNVKELINKNQFNFTSTIQVRYSELDLQGIVFNANYLIYFDVLIGEYFKSRGIPYSNFV